MATYAIYKIEFQQARQGQLFSVDTGKSTLDDAQRILGDVLKDKLMIRKEKRGGEVAILDNYIEKWDGDVAVMVVCNEKEIKYKEKKDEVTLATHPGCRVIIDNRPDICQMAIERDDSFNGKTDSVRDLLQDALNKRLEEYRLVVTIKAKKRATEFWRMIDEQVYEHKDRPTKVIFTFPNPKEVTPIDTSPSMATQLNALRAICSAVDATKGVLQMESEKGAQLHIDRTREDMAEMVKLCSQNSYDISVHFKHYGVYRFGTTVKALFELKDEVMTDFLRGQRSYEISLVEWLDEIRNKIEEYDDEEPIEKVRKRRHKEAV